MCHSLKQVPKTGRQREKEKEIEKEEPNRILDSRLN